MTHRLLVAYRAGRNAYPDALDNPYAHTGDMVAARMWRLGWQRRRDENQETPSAEETLRRVADEMGW